MCRLAEQTQRSLCAWFQVTGIYTACTGAGVAACTCPDGWDTRAHLLGSAREAQRSDDAYESQARWRAEALLCLSTAPRLPHQEGYPRTQTRSQERCLGQGSGMQLSDVPFLNHQPLLLRYAINRSACRPGRPSLPLSPSRI